MKYQTLFEPITIGKLKLQNRFAMCAMGPIGLGDCAGGFNQRGVDYYVERAKGGTGLIITGVTHAANNIEKHRSPSAPSPTVNPEWFIRTSREMTERIHSYGSHIFLQLSAGFGRVFAEFGNDTPIAPSAKMNRWFDVMCRPLTIDEIHDIVRQMGEAARIAKQAGFDGIQVHAVHEGYLLDQFATKYFNERTDEYGGSLENRLRFAREVVEEIKKTCGQDFPVAVRYSPKHFMKGFREGALPGEDFVEMGRDLDEGIEAAKLLVEYGYDVMDVDVGCYDAWFWNHPPMYQEKGLYREYAKMVKDVVDVPVICAGRMDNPDMATEAIADGVCDIIGLARPLLADPDYVNKLRQDDVAGIRPCLSCHEGCLGRMQKYKNISCAVNPTCARERYTRLVPALKPRKVLIAGGGPGGMEAARVLALRGHQPILCEKSDRLGGNLIPGGMPDFKEDDHALVAWYEEQLRRLDVDVRMNTEVTAEMVEAGDFDDVIVATGSRPKRFPLGDAKIQVAEEVLMNIDSVGQDIVVIGGGLVGCELALWLANEGRKVTIVEALDDILKLNGPLCFANVQMLRLLLDDRKIDLVCSASAKGYEDGCVIADTPDGEVRIKADNVIECVGYAPNGDLFEALRYGKAKPYQIGDAAGVANILNAIWSAYELASNI